MAGLPLPLWSSSLMRPSDSNSAHRSTRTLPVGIVSAGSIQLNISASVHRPGNATSQSPREDNEAITLLCSTKDKKPERPHSLQTSTEKLSLARHCLCLDITTILYVAIFQRATWKSSSPAPPHAMMSVIEGSHTHTRTRQGLPSQSSQQLMGPTPHLSGTNITSAVCNRRGWVCTQVTHQSPAPTADSSGRAESSHHIGH